ncbi:MAG TPA: hypothetical protein VHP37_22715 [Burkholderiales bacterium]|nr:hypothetical protein [Burkholderiales bacterium]
MGKQRLVTRDVLARTRERSFGVRNRAERFGDRGLVLPRVDDEQRLVQRDPLSRLEQDALHRSGHFGPQVDLAKRAHLADQLADDVGIALDHGHRDDLRRRRRRRAFLLRAGGEGKHEAAASDGAQARHGRNVAAASRSRVAVIAESAPVLRKIGRDTRASMLLQGLAGYPQTKPRADLPAYRRPP